MEIKGNGLVGLVVVSHSNKLAEEVINFANKNKIFIKGIKI